MKSRLEHFRMKGRIEAFRFSQVIAFVLLVASIVTSIITGKDMTDSGIVAILVILFFEMRMISIRLEENDIDLRRRSCYHDFPTRTEGRGKVYDRCKKCGISVREWVGNNG